MRRLLRLLTLCLLALALPMQGALAAQGMDGAAMAGHAMSMPISMPMPAAMHVVEAGADAVHHATPCPHHDAAKPACAACCGPAVAARDVLAVAPVGARALPASRVAAGAPAPQFLTGGLDRPPRTALA